MRPHKLSFKGVTNCVIRLMQSVKFNAEIPFSDVLSTSQSRDSMPHQGKVSKTMVSSSSRAQTIKFNYSVQNVGTEKPNKALRNRYDNLLKMVESPVDRVNKYLAQALTARSIEREKSNNIHFLTLNFTNKDKENGYQATEDITFGCSLVCTLIMLVLMVGLQVVILPRTYLLLILFIVAFAWPSTILIFILSTKLKCTNVDLSKWTRLRVFLTITTVSIPYLMVQVNVLCCSGGHGLSFLDSLSLMNQDRHLTCSDPNYIIVSGILCFFLLALFIKINPLIKVICMVIITAGHIVVMEFTHKSLFAQFDDVTHAFMPTDVYGILAFVMFLLGFSLQNREQEWTLRLDYLWKSQATEEKSGMQELQRQNSRILCNLLPEHVANHFLNLQTNSHMELYSQQYNKVAVFFASIPNFSNFYVELAANNQGVECLRVLNEIIADFDELLDVPYFYGVEKIKTIGSCYMAATGLKPSHLVKVRDESITFYITMLVDFVMAMKEKLKNINENSYNNFELRVGINVGPVVAGVIGARKPQYDIWGNTVNVASRMESTGVSGRVQVTEEVYAVLKNVFTFECRGKVPVKGKGDMITYLLKDRIVPRDPNCIYPPPTPPESPQVDSPHPSGTPTCRSLESLPPTMISNDSPVSPSLRTLGKSASAEHPVFTSSTERIQHQTSTMERQRGASTPTGSLNKKRQNSMDSPSMHRNPLRKLSSSSAGNTAQGNVGGPELPAVHFFNAKMQNQQARPVSVQVQNSIFDSLKAKVSSPTSPGSPTSPKSTVSDGARATKVLGDGGKAVTMAGSNTSRGQTTSLHSLRKVSSEPNCKPPAIPLTGSSPPHSRTNAPPIYQCVSPPTKPHLKRVTEDAILEDMTSFNSHGKCPNKAYLPSDATLHNGIVLGQSNKQESYYAQLSECLTRPLKPSPEDVSRNSNDRFVTGVYREPIDKCPSSTSSQRSRESFERCQSTTPSLRSTASSEQTVIIHDDVSEYSPEHKKGDKQASAAVEDMTSPSSNSTVTPTGGLVASIDGKTMSLFYDPRNNTENGMVPSAPKPWAAQVKPWAIQRNGLRYGQNEAHQIKSSYRKSYPSVPTHKLGASLSPLKKRREAFNMNFVSDDEKDSISSHPPSDHSSIVFLNPIELKPSRNALIRHLPHQDDKHSVLSYVFTSPYSTLDRFRSRSSDTINSIPHCPPTPKFPIPEASASLTQLLQELTQEYDQPDLDTLLYDEPENRPSHHMSGYNKPPKSPETREKDHLKRRLNSGMDNQGVLPSTRMAPNVHRLSINPFQIKRRQPHSIPPRHCRSLDYIPSDREDATSPVSSACASPKTRHAYLMPLIFGAQTAASRAEHTSLSSLASSSEMSQSDPHINGDSGSAAYESEYDNYRPGTVSDDDLFVPDHMSDMDMFDDMNIDDVTVSDNFSMDMPVPRFSKKITEV
ncbi:unnamed protein product [Lymnaea stagnalis]|uniref:adenylate cyclase n=1 Tax=Lymnaea stagnalis TaxID=6523 RepID=A0AAV2II45_LYMST